MIRRAFLGAAAAALVTATPAHANGRPPQTNGIAFRPSDAHSLYVRSTFGLLISHDDGCTFDWVCDDAMGFGGTYDPQYAITADGTIFLTTFSGLRVSRDGGCSFQIATDELPAGDPNRLDVNIGALAVAPSGTVWIGTADSSRPTALYSSTDNGVTFAARDTQLGMVGWNSLAAPDAMHVYATGTSIATTQSATLRFTLDGGASWMTSALAGVALASAPQLAVVAADPNRPAVVYIASRGTNSPAGDVLYRSSDGGATLAPVLTTTDSISDVAIVDAMHVVAATQRGGSFASADGGVTFAPLASPPQLACLALRPDNILVGCGANWDPDFEAVATSADVGASWQKVWRFVDIAGPLACPAGTAQHDACAANQWPVLAQQFGATGPTCGSNIWPGEPPPPPPKRRGCCDAGDGALTSLWSAVAVTWLVLRRRRDRSQRDRERDYSATSAPPFSRASPVDATNGSITNVL